MTVNSRIVGTATGALVYPSVGGTPAAEAVVLIDGAGNVIKTADNGDGTATLVSATTGESTAAAVTDNLANPTTGQVAADAMGFNGTGWDRLRTLQGKGVASNTLNGIASLGQNQAFLNSGSVPAVGQAVYLMGGTPEVAYVASVVGLTLTFTANLLYNHSDTTAVKWDAYAGPYGPGLTGFLPTGVRVSAPALYESVGGLYHTERVAHAVALTGADQAVMNAPCDYRGFTIRETAGAAAVVILYDHASAASGTILEQIALAPLESAREFYPANGVRAALGIYCDVVSGTVAGSVRVS